MDYRTSMFNNMESPSYLRSTSSLRELERKKDSPTNSVCSTGRRVRKKRRRRLTRSEKKYRKRQKLMAALRKSRCVTIAPLRKRRYTVPARSEVVIPAERMERKSLTAPGRDRRNTVISVTTPGLITLPWDWVDITEEEI